MTVNDPEVIRWVIESPKTVAVVGLSDNPARPSHHVSAEMQARGFRVIPVTPKKGPILGEQVYRSLAEIPFPVDVVNVFRRSEHVMDVIRDLEQLAVKPRVLWLQQGIVNDQAVEAAAAMGIDSVQNRCIYVEAVRAGK